MILSVFTGGTLPHASHPPLAAVHGRCGPAGFYPTNINLNNYFVDVVFTVPQSEQKIESSRPSSGVVGQRPYGVLRLIARAQERGVDGAVAAQDVSNDLAAIINAASRGDRPARSRCA